jgi:signal transduction histidine kinase
VHRVVADVVTFLKPGIDSRFVLKQELLAKPSIILGDPVQLENAVLNLALNARDAMPDGGELVFTTGIVPLGASACATFAGHYDIVPGNYLQLSVTDTGCGMDEATVNRIFEPFFTTKEPGKGTGMGLPAVYGAMLSHKGAIAVQSEPGHGSSFHLYFPLSAIEAPIAGPPVSPEPPFPTEYPV